MRDTNSDNVVEKFSMKIYVTALITAMLLTASLSHAGSEIHLKMADPEWHFLVDNQPPGKTDAQLNASERGFAQHIQPLLAEQNYAGVLDAFSQRAIEKDSAALRQLRGQVLLAQKQYDQAEQALKAALDLMPNLALAHRSLSMVYMLKKDYVNARVHLQKSIELGVADAQVYGQLAFVNLQMGRGASAVAGYQQALFLDADNQQWQQGLLYALTDSHALDQAQALVEEMLQKDSDNVELWLLRSRIALQRDKQKDALKSLEVAFSLGENAPENFAVAAQLHLQQGSQQRAVELLSGNLQRMTAKNSESMLATIDQVVAWLVFQESWPAVSQMVKALDKVDKAQSIPSFYQARFDVYRAQLAMEKGDDKQVRQRLQTAIKTDPSNGDALMALGDFYKKHNQLEQAAMYLVRAEALPEFKERALLSRAQLEIDRKAYSEALRLLRQVVQLNPARGDIVANIRSLENLVRNQG